MTSATDLGSIVEKNRLNGRLACGLHEEAGVFCYTSRIVPPIKPEQANDDSSDKNEENQYEVRIIDNDYNTYEEVIKISMFALGIDFDEAYAIAWEVDHIGSCVVARGPWSECMEIASIIGRIGIETQVNPLNNRSN